MLCPTNLEEAICYSSCLAIASSNIPVPNFLPFLKTSVNMATNLEDTKFFQEQKAKDKLIIRGTTFRVNPLMPQLTSRRRLAKVRP